MNIYYVDGRYVKANEAVIPVDDLAIIRGFGVFDLLRTYDGVPVFLFEHVKRLENSAREVGIAFPWTHDEMATIAMETLGRNDLEEANIRIIITGGSSPDFITPQDKPRLIVIVTPVPVLPSWWYEKGVKVISMLSERNVPGAKSIDYIPATMALEKAKSLGAIEAIYVDRDGFVMEGTTSNLFAIINGQLITPGRGMLAGITRKVILKITETMYETLERDISLAELLQADEIFITGSNKGLVPVVDVDGNGIGTGRPGVETEKIAAALREYTTVASTV